MPVYKIYKNLGETPLQALEKLRLEKNIDPGVSMTYAGRLDPAAEGEMYIITGDDIKNKDDYLGKDKVYEVEYILGISTDTGDLLGVLKNFVNKEIQIDETLVKQILSSLSGRRQQLFHAFSSKTVGGVPMWVSSRQGLETKATHNINIKRIELLGMSTISVDEIYQRVQKITELVSLDFRQDLIIESWKNFKNIKLNLPIIKIYANVSTGTYMRVLGEEIGELLNLPVCAYSIVRKEIIN